MAAKTEKPTNLVRIHVMLPEKLVERLTVEAKLAGKTFEAHFRDVLVATKLERVAPLTVDDKRTRRLVSPRVDEYARRILHARSVELKCLFSDLVGGILEDWLGRTARGSRS